MARSRSVKRVAQGGGRNGRGVRGSVKSLHCSDICSQFRLSGFYALAIFMSSRHEVSS